MRPLRILLRILACLAALALGAFALLVIGPEVRYALAGHPWGWALVAGAALLCGLCLWGAIWAAAGRNPLGAHRPRADARAPRRFVGARLALGYVVLVGSYLLLGLPFPPMSRDEWWSAALLTLSCGAALVGAVAIGRPRPVGRWAVLAGGAWGVVSLARGTWMLRASNIPDPSPGIVWSLVLAGSLFVMWVLAAIVVLSAWRSWPSRA